MNVDNIFFCVIIFLIIIVCTILEYKKLSKSYKEFEKEKRESNSYIKNLFH